MDMQAILGFFKFSWGDSHPFAFESLSLARWLGLYIAIMSLFTLLRGDFVRAVANDFRKSPALQAFAGSFGVLFGTLLVTFHSVFEFGWPVLITLFGYIVLLRGIFRLFFPEKETQIFNYLDRHPSFLTVWSLIWLVIGVVLIWFGFFQRPI